MDDLIRRSDVLREIKNIAPIGCKSVGSDAQMIMQMVEDLSPVRPGAMLEPMVVENPDWKLYTKEIGDVRVEYRYGPDWVAMELMMEGGYKTPEEAKLRWLEYWEARK